MGDDLLLDLVGEGVERLEDGDGLLFALHSDRVNLAQEVLFLEGVDGVGATEDGVDAHAAFLDVDDVGVVDESPMKS